MAYAKANNPKDAYGAAAQTASKTRQLVMLYDGLIGILQRTKQAIDENNIQDRFNLTNKALKIIAGLEGSIDFEQGGEIAKLLEDFYTTVDMRLLMIQGGQHLTMIDPVIKEVKMMRDAWSQVDAGEEKASQAAAAPDAPLPAQENISVSV